MPPSAWSAKLMVIFESKDPLFRDKLKKKKLSIIIILYIHMYEWWQFPRGEGGQLPRGGGGGGMPPPAPTPIETLGFGAGSKVHAS